jgi:hypothetical protein
LKNCDNKTTTKYLPKYMRCVANICYCGLHNLPHIKKVAKYNKLQVHDDCGIINVFLSTANLFS